MIYEGLGIGEGVESMMHYEMVIEQQVTTLGIHQNQN